ncbi:VCBS repeat-containing protein [bacterium]|nr:VCBS repeat-containing protein [bacterium]
MMGLILFLPVLSAQTQTPGHWDYILGHEDKRDYVYAIHVYDGQVYLGGDFDHSGNWFGGDGIKGIAQYFRDGRMDEVGGGVHGLGFQVLTICQTSQGLVIGGNFVMAGNKIVNNIALFDGSSWQGLAGGVNSTVLAVAEYHGEIYAGGKFTRVNGQRQYYIAKWDGSQWSAVGEPLNGPVHSMIVYQDKLIVGGRFGLAGDLAVNHLAAWNGQAWSAFGGGTNGNVLAMAVQGDDLIIGGRFEIAGGVTVNKIARWNGSAMEPVGQGFWGNVYALAVDGDDIYAGGEFTRAVGYDGLFNYIAKWNGNTWQKLFEGLDAPVYALGVKGKDLFIGGKFQTPDWTYTYSWYYYYYYYTMEGKQYHFIRWRNPVPETPFKRHVEAPFNGYTQFSIGLAWVDYDNDGDEDIMIPDTDISRIYSNEGQGKFTEITTNPSWQHREIVSWADYDNDGDQDFLAGGDRYSWSGNPWKTFNINDGNGNFQTSDKFNFTPTFTIWGGTWGDFNNDGFTDFLVNDLNDWNNRMQTLILYSNISGDHFSSEEVFGYRPFYPHFGDLSWSDIDNDGDIDVFYNKSNSWWTWPAPVPLWMAKQETSDLFINDGSGHFDKTDAGDLTSDVLVASHPAWGDYDNDGDFDVFVNVQNNENNMLYTNQGDGTFKRVTDSPVVQDGGFSKQGQWIDFDNDGDLDLFVLNRKHGDNFMYENLGDGTFRIMQDNAFTNVEDNGFFSAWHDYDRDGDCDLIMFGQNSSPVFMLENTQNTGNHWLNLKLVGVKSNRDALGAKVHVKSFEGAEMKMQTREVNGQAGWCQNSREVVIGLGGALAADVLIEWPSGILQSLGEVAADQFLVVEEDEDAALEKPAGLSARDMLEYGLDAELAMASKPEVPDSYGLSSCYPNPFNPSTEIAYALPRESGVTIRIINALGQEVRMLVNQKQVAGTYRVRWDGLDLRGNAVPSGLYLCRMESDGFVQTQKMMLVR